MLNPKYSTQYLQLLSVRKDNAGSTPFRCLECTLECSKCVFEKIENAKQLFLPIKYDQTAVRQHAEGRSEEHRFESIEFFL